MVYDRYYDNVYWTLTEITIVVFTRPTRFSSALLSGDEVRHSAEWRRRQNNELETLYKNKEYFRKYQNRKTAWDRTYNETLKLVTKNGLERH